jgi:hypothetical protein
VLVVDMSSLLSFTAATPGRADCDADCEPPERPLADRVAHVGVRGRGEPQLGDRLAQVALCSSND